MVVITNASVFAERTRARGESRTTTSTTTHLAVHVDACAGTTRHRCRITWAYLFLRSLPLVFPARCCNSVAVGVADIIIAAAPEKAHFLFWVRGGSAFTADLKYSIK